MIVFDYHGRKTVLLPVDTQEGNHEWYSLLGFLANRGLTSYLSISALNEQYPRGGAVVLFAGKSDRGCVKAREILNSFGPSWKTFIAGREVAYQHAAYQSLIADRGRAVTGDPHYFVAGIIEGRSGTEQPDLWDPDDYQCSYIDAPWIGNTAYLRFGNGCQRRCGYCPYGYHYQKIYGSERLRVRPAAAMEKEIDQWTDAGKNDFRLVADQVLACPQAGNERLEEVCRMIGSRTNGGRLSFTTTPFDVVRNSMLLERCQRLVALRIFLCIDFMADNLLKRFDLPTREEDIVGALELLSGVRIAVYPHFIFLNPFMDLASLLKTIDLMEIIVPKIRAHCGQAALELARALFCSALRTDAVTPPCPDLRLAIANSAPETGVLNLAAVMMRIFHSKALYLRLAKATEQYPDWPKRLATACRHLIADATDESLWDERTIADHANCMTARI